VVLREIYGPKREKVAREWRNYTTKRERGELLPGFWYGDLKDRDHFKDLSINGRIILQWVLNEEDWREWSSLTWLKIWTKCTLLSR
jgi:hypothetical protein